MKPSSTKKQQESSGFHKYLKPGALAKLRDSRISARSHNDDSAMTRMLESALSACSTVVRRPVDDVPVFVSYGESQCLKRKRLVASNSVLCIGSRDSDVLAH